jgi:hypothetical protein
MVDLWSTETGAVFDACSIIIPMTATAAITEGYPVHFAVSTTAQVDKTIYVTMIAAPCDSYFVATRAALAAGDVIGVLTYGPYKMSTSGIRIAAGSFVAASQTNCVGECWQLGFGPSTFPAYGTQASYILGMAMQTAVTARDSILVLVGKCQ